ncbi:MAG: cyclic nucleotide-binding domain-containing protein, partial [Pseudomonadota bacterium]
ILSDINLEIPKGSRVAIKVPSQLERTALADLLTREVLPARGTITMAGYDLERLHQRVIAARIGYAQSRPYFFDGTLGSNLMMPLQTHPKMTQASGKMDKDLIEAGRAGNSPDSLLADWSDPTVAEFTEDGDIHGWWFKLIQAMGIDEVMFRRMLEAQIDPELHPNLTARAIALRPKILQALQAKGLDEDVYRFDKTKFNPTVPLGANLLFAAPRIEISQTTLASTEGLMGLVLAQGLGEQIIAISQTVLETLQQTFGKDGTEHPLFQDLGIEDELYEQLTDIAERRRKQGDAALSDEEFALLLTVPFFFTAEQIGPAFPKSFRDEIVTMRNSRGAALRAAAGDRFIPITPDAYFPRLTLIENLLYGRISRFAGAREALIKDIVAEVLDDSGLRQDVAETIWDVPSGIAGSNLGSVFQERAAFSRAAIKRPDILILDKALASHDAQSRSQTRAALRDLLPDSTLIFMEDEFNNPDAYDIYVEIKNGRIDDLDFSDSLTEDGADDLQRKLRFISRAELFEPLAPRNQRLIAFSADWFAVAKGNQIFEIGDEPDAVYLCTKGAADLFYERDGGRTTVTTVEPGRVIGDLSVITNEKRRQGMVATENSEFLRIGAHEYLSVIKNDPDVSFALLRTVSARFNIVAAMAQEAGAPIPSRAAQEALSKEIQERLDQSAI